MRHYDTVMPWVGLFRFGHGLATFAGPHVIRALLFPMEEVFEDFARRPPSADCRGVARAGHPAARSGRIGLPSA